MYVDTARKNIKANMKPLTAVISQNRDQEIRKVDKGAFTFHFIFLCGCFVFFFFFLHLLKRIS